MKDLLERLRPRGDKRESDRGCEVSDRVGRNERGSMWGKLASEWMERTGSHVYTLGERGNQDFPYLTSKNFRGRDYLQALC